MVHKLRPFNTQRVDYDSISHVGVDCIVWSGLGLGLGLGFDVVLFNHFDLNMVHCFCITSNGFNSVQHRCTVPIFRET